MNLRIAPAVFVLVITLGRLVEARAQDALAPGDPATARLAEVAKTYRSLSYYEDQGSFLRGIRQEGHQRTESSPLVVKFKKPNLLLLDAGEVTVVSDGQRMSTILHPTKRFVATPAPAALNPTLIADGPAGAILLGGAAGPPAQILLKMLFGREGESLLPDRSSAIKMDTPHVWQDANYDCLQIEQADEPPLRLYIDPKTNLIRRMEYVFDEASLASRISPEQGLLGMTLEWTSGAITTEEPANSPFVLPAMEGYLKIEPAKPKVSKENVSRMMGKHSPDLTVSLLDGADTKERFPSRNALNTSHQVGETFGVASLSAIVDIDAEGIKDVLRAVIDRLIAGEPRPTPNGTMHEQAS